MISKLIKELEKLDRYLEYDFRKKLRDAEIKGFFIVRHLDVGNTLTPALTPLQRYVIKEWEPRVVKLIDPLTQEEYSKLRTFLGMNHPVVLKYKDYPKDKKPSWLNDKLYEAHAVYDLRDEVKESARSTPECSGQCNCGK